MNKSNHFTLGFILGAVVMCGVVWVEHVALKVPYSDAPACVVIVDCALIEQVQGLEKQTRNLREYARQNTKYLNERCKK